MKWGDPGLQELGIFKFLSYYYAKASVLTEQAIRDDMERITFHEWIAKFGPKEKP